MNYIVSGGQPLKHVYSLTCVMKEARPCLKPNKSEVLLE